MIGEKWGRLLILAVAGKDSSRGFKYLCRCDCGTEKIIASGSIRRGVTKSCGCLNKEILRQVNRTHGKSYTSVYKRWEAMIQRCTNPNDKKYIYYGGRGVTVCESWKKFENFYRDMGDPPEDKSLDRIDNNGNYEPSNCRWAYIEQQANNQRRYLR